MIEKGFIGDKITDANGREETIFMTRRKILRTGVAKISFQEIPAVIGIGHPAADPLVAMR